MKAKLIKTENGYGLKDCELIAFVSTVRTEHRHHKLSLKNCQAIERGYDLDELCENYAANPMSNFAKYGDEYVAKNSFGRGFLKALEILGDRKFTEEDMRKMYNISCGKKDLWYDTDQTKNNKRFNKLFQSLQQNEWECIILLDEETNKPLLDANGCLILKRS